MNRNNKNLRIVCFAVLAAAAAIAVLLFLTGGGAGGGQVIPSPDTTVAVTDAESLPETEPLSTEPPDDTGPVTGSSDTQTLPDTSVTEDPVSLTEDPADTRAAETAPDSSEDTTAAQTEYHPVTTEPAPQKPKPRVGITQTTTAPGMNVYIRAAAAAGFETVTLPVVSTEAAAKNALAGVDAIILTGGEDLDPKWYGEEPICDEKGNNLNVINAKRDTSDMLYIKCALELDMPMLCICRGMQLLNVACGGTLWQDIPTQVGGTVTHRDPNKRVFVTHLIRIEKGSLLNTVVGYSVARVNSWHHQAVKDVGDGLVVTARADDGIIEAMEMPGKTFVFATQFHPEQLVNTGYTAYRAVFSRLCEEAGLYRERNGR
ncbi:MAG: gamma-glutamyl-gamma-aminobutyrate hydrolase family protein [Clostridia bacterium]|nr:gamma-glutamyl-gamma-aminobutyrate hydrolase family protein [Clostridia bacterium]